MALSTQPYKGARDFYPEDKRLQDYIFGVWRQVAQSYGYQEYDAPLIEPLDLYRAKTGDEIVNEQLYSFVDRGGREVAIRPEMTPTVSRMVAGRRQELAYPLRWFSIPNLWRYERPQRGRLREHWQLNVDIFGEAGLSADHEIISVADSIMKAFGAKPDMYAIKLNSRKLMDTLFSEAWYLNDAQVLSMAKLVDRMHKTERPAFEAQVGAICTPSQRDAGLPEMILRTLAVKKLSDLPELLGSHASAASLTKLMDLLQTSGVTNAEFDITLMRGFDYYDDIVFEVFDTHPENNRSMFGGGRYDGLVGLFGVEPVPTAGFGMGDVTLANFLELHGLVPMLPQTTELAIVLIGDVYEKSLPLINMLRREGLAIAVDATDRKIDKKLKNLSKQGIRYALFIGENELAEEQYPLKDLATGTEEKHSAERTVALIKDFRQKQN